MPATPLSRLLARQDGLITLAQAAELGISRRAVGRRVESGQWRRVAPRVAQAYGEPLTPQVRVRTAALWSGGVVSGMAAAWHHGLVDRPGPIVDVTVPRRRNPGALHGVRVRRRDLDPRDVVRHDGLPVLGAPLAALEVAVLLPGGGAILDHALRRRIRWPDLLAAYRRAMGTAGSGRMRVLVVAAADRADSEAERILFRLLREAGITGWTRAFRFGGRELDLAFEEGRVAVELDGWAWHVDHDRFTEDRRKQNALVQAGWTVLRFTWHDLTDDPKAVVTEIRRALRLPRHDARRPPQVP